MQHQSRHGHPAFTLVEMLAVISIIVILATVLVSSMSYVNEKRARSQVKVQLGMLDMALEKYHSDFSTYPATDDSPKGDRNSHILFNALYWDPNGDGQTVGTATGDAAPKPYLPELDPASNKQGWTSGKPSSQTKIVDPWNNEYRYRSGNNAAGKPNNSTRNSADFDLWSVGKDGQTNPAMPKDKVNRDDIWYP